MVINTDTKAITQAISYDSFGNVLSDTNPGFQPFYFAGGLYDIDTKLLRYGAREYDPEVGRWMSKDPILFQGLNTNLYSYVNSDPVNYIDPTGLRPGDSYGNINDAARNAINDINRRSINEGVEYGGWIYKNPKGGYSYTSPGRGQGNTIDLPPKPEGACGDYHTHGSADPEYNNENFSRDDKAGNKFYNMPGFLGTPSGRMKKYDPVKDRTTTIW